MENVAERNKSSKDQSYQVVVTLFGLVLWLAAAGETVAVYSGRDLLMLAAVVPLIVIIDLFPINLPVPAGRKSTREKITFTLIDAFVLTIAGWYGIAPAVLIAGIEGFTSSRRQVRRLSSNLFSSGMMSLTAAAASIVLTAALGHGWTGAAIAHGHGISAVAAGLLVASIVQIGVNWALLSSLLALRYHNSILQLWTQNVLWSAPVFLPTSVAATLMYFAAQNGAVAMMAIGGPVLLAVYFGHHQTRLRVEQVEKAERERADQAERHVEELSRYIAEQKRIHEQYTQIEKLSALGELASGVAHDLNNTLAGILGRAQLVQAHSKDPAEVARGLELIIKTAMDGAKTVKRIQDFARQRRDHDFEPVAVDQLLSDVTEITRPRWKDRAEAANLHINVELHSSTDAMVMGDASELREVLVNLVFNAVDAMPAGGQIMLSATEAEGQIEIRVSDSGTGMTDEIRSRVFDPFFTTKGKAGMGLGLAVSYGIICRHDGSVEVESEIGRGTTFIIRLPKARKKALAQVSATNATNMIASPPPAQHQLRILIVDDDDFVREMFCELLQSLGHQVAEAEDGFKALELFEAEAFDAVFTDVGMPGMTGWDLARSIRERDARIPLAIITGWGEAAGLNEQKSAKVDWVIAKPFTAECIEDIVRQIFSRGLATTTVKRRQLSLVA